MGWEGEGKYIFERVLTKEKSNNKNAYWRFYKLQILTPGFFLGVARSSQGYKYKSADYSGVIIIIAAVLR